MNTDPPNTDVEVSLSVLQGHKLKNWEQWFMENFMNNSDIIRQEMRLSMIDSPLIHSEKLIKSGNTL